ncbi:hypothetical protein ACC697_39575, partial [Rhizobium ruizarguesonis]
AADLFGGERRRTIFIDKKHLTGEASRGAIKLQERQTGFFSLANSRQATDFIPIPRYPKIGIRLDRPNADGRRPFSKSG